MPTGSRLIGLLALLPLVANAANDVCDGYGRLTGSEALTSGDVVVSMPQRNGHFGYSIVNVGDINNDGFDDVAIGSPGAAMNGAGSGAVFIFFGPTENEGDFSANQADVVFVGPAPGARMGSAIAGVGDVNGDGYEDMVLGLVPDPSSPSDGFIPEGGALLIEGAPSFAGVVDSLDVAAARIRGAALGDDFGVSVAGGADLNGDGFDDIIIGAPLADTVAGADAGAAYVFYGPVVGDVTAYDASRTLHGGRPGGRAGASVSVLGDVDADGLPDFAVGAPRESTNGSKSGAVYLVHGSYDHELMGDGSTYEPGTLVGACDPGDPTCYACDLADPTCNPYCAPGSANCNPVCNPHVDPYCNPYCDPAIDLDCVVECVPGVDAGCNLACDPGVDEQCNPHCDPDSGLCNATCNPFFDPNCNPHCDPITGCDAFCDPVLDPGCDGIGTQTETFVFQPTQENLEASEWIVRGAAGDRLGNTVTAAGDVNQDGYADFWVGAHQYGASKRGAVYLVHGASSMWGDHVAESVYAARIRGTDAIDVFGSSIAGAADFDGDGNLDVLVGAERADGDEFGSGAAYVIHGPFPTDSVAADHPFIVRGAEQYDFAGGATAAMDINNDGFDDAFVGSWRADTTRNRGGRTSIFFGGADLRDIQPWFVDEDGDGWGTTASETWACLPLTGWVDRGGDCDDQSTDFHPYALEEDCSDLTDYNCDGSVGLVDEDGDGFNACEGDCNDAEAATHVTASEWCWDRIDNNCDGGVDDGLSEDGQEWFPDADSDGFGNRLLGVRSCEQPPWLLGDVVHVGGDCDDFNGSTFPGAPEYCDSVDNNCDNEIDEFSAVDAKPWFADADGDGRGDVTARMDACSAPSGFVADAGDCDDGNAEVYPGAVEICNFIDDDCDGFGYHGGPEIIDAPVAEFWGERVGDRFGGRLELVPDMNGDGFAESLIAAHWNGERNRNAGAVYLRYGDPYGGVFDMAETLDDGSRRYTARILADQADGFFGESLAAGDFNGDGHGDIAIGAPGMRGPGLDAGGVFIFYGPLEGEYSHRDADVWWRGEENFDFLGAALDAEDLDGDGLDDLVIGATGVAAGGDRRGRAYVVYGSEDWGNGLILDNADAWLSGREDKEYIGETVAVLGDVNGDGWADIAAGAPRAGELDTGTVLIVQGSDARMTGELTAHGEIAGYRSSGELGFAMAGPGDVDGDGYDDVLIGTQGNEAFLMLGSASGVSYGRINEVYDHRFLAPEDSFEFVGNSLSAVGDVNQDGFDDMLIGGRESDANGADSGAVYMVFGGTGMPSDLGLDMLESFGRVLEDRDYPTFSVSNLEGRWEGGKLIGADEFHQFGSAIAGGEDINNDGYPDMLISSVWADEGRGRVAVIYNSPYGVDWEPAPGSDWDYGLTVDGRPDEWVDAIRSSTATGDDYVVTWDPENIYLGYQGSDVVAASSSAYMVTYFGDGDPTTGSTTGVSLGGQQPELSFSADMGLMVLPAYNFSLLLIPNGSGWSYEFLYGAGHDMVLDTETLAMELSISREVLGLGDTLEISSGWVFTGTDPQTYNSMPAGSFDAGLDPDWGQHVRFDMGMPLAPTNYPVQPEGGDAPHITDFHEWWVHDRDLDGQGDDTPTLFWACPMHAPMAFPDPVGLTNLDNVTIAGVQDMALATDCDDYNDTVYLGARELPDDGLDNDCTEDVNNIPVVTVTMDTQFTDEIAWAQVDVVDRDEGTPHETPITLFYEWYVNGERVVGQTGNTLDGNVYFDKGDEVTVQVVASDGLDISEASTATFTTPNAPPTIEDCWLEPVDATIADNIRLECITHDRDGDEVVIESLEGSSGFETSPDWQGQINADLYDGAALIPADDGAGGYTLEPHLAIRALVVAHDGQDESESFLTDILRPGSPPADTDTADSDSTPTTNNPPVVENCAISPEPLHYTEDAEVTPLGSDVDGDPVLFSISWIVNGSLVRLEQVQNGETHTLPADLTGYEIGDEITVICTPFDGTDLGVSADDTLFVRDFDDTDGDSDDTDGDTDDTDGSMDTGIDCIDSTDMRYQLTTKNWAYEMSWSIQNTEGDVVFSPGATVYPNYSVHNYEFSLEPGFYRVHMQDSYGDGWNGGYFEMFDQRDGSDLAFTGGMSSGHELFHIFRVECNGDVTGVGEFFPEGDTFTVCGEVSEIDPLTGDEVPSGAASITAAFDTTDNIIGGVLSATDGAYCLSGIAIPDSWNPSTQPYFLTATKLGFATDVKTSPYDFVPSVGATLEVDFVLTPIDIEVCFEETFETLTPWTYENPVSTSHDVGWTRYAYDPANPVFNESIPHCTEQPEDELCNTFSPSCVLCEDPEDERCIPEPAAIPTPWGGDHYAWFGNSNQGTGTNAGGTYMGRGGNCDPNSGISGNGGWSTINDMEGNMLSPIFTAPTGDAEMQLSAWFEIESVDPHKPPYGYDQLIVSVIRVSSGAETMVGSMNSQIDLDGRPGQNYASGGFGKAPIWNVYRFDLSAFAGDEVQLKFRFWSRDEKYNGFRGWGIDDIYVYTTEVGGCAN